MTDQTAYYVLYGKRAHKGVCRKEKEELGRLADAAGWKACLQCESLTEKNEGCRIMHYMYSKRWCWSVRRREGGLHVCEV